MRNGYFNLRKIVDFILGFISVPIYEFITGWTIVIVISKLNPELLEAWDKASLATKLFLGASGMIIPVFFVCYFWRSRRFISIGILVYLAFGLLVSILGY